MAKYDLTEQAVSDLKEIARYTKREWSKEQARRYREELALSLEKLSLSPASGRRREEIAPGVRSFRVAAHIAFYVEKRGGIIILRLLHPHRDIDLAFQKELANNAGEFAVDEIKTKTRTTARAQRNQKKVKVKPKAKP